MVRSYGLGPPPGVVNGLTPWREVKQMTGNHRVPLRLRVTDEAEPIQGSKRIIAWAQATQMALRARPLPEPRRATV